MVFGVQEEDVFEFVPETGFNLGQRDFGGPKSGSGGAYFDVFGAIATNGCLDLEVKNFGFWSPRRGLAQAVYAI